jgi:multicomponent Na+:H+ antiporter subunit G
VDTVGEVLVLAACALTLLSGIGVVRFSDVFIRMHALSKASTLGLLLALLGAALVLRHPNDVTSLLLAGLLHLVTSPIGTNLLARTTYLAEGIAQGVDTTDELAERQRVQATGSSTSSEAE